MTYDNCNTKDTLCDDRDKNCVIMLETLEMNVKDVCMVILTHSHKYNPLKLEKQDSTHYATTNIQKDGIFPFLKRGPNI